MEIVVVPPPTVPHLRRPTESGGGDIVVIRGISDRRAIVVVSKGEVEIQVLRIQPQVAPAPPRSTDRRSSSSSLTFLVYGEPLQKPNRSSPATTADIKTSSDFLTRSAVRQCPEQTFTERNLRSPTIAEGTTSHLTAFLYLAGGMPIIFLKTFVK